VIAAATDRRVVITGLGLVNAAGLGVDPFWQALLDGDSRLTPIGRFDASEFPVQVVGEITGFEAASVIPRRFVAKTDRFTHFALAATDQAIADSALALDAEDRGRIGVWFGNTTGGWDICERGFAEYYEQGPDVVNPWQATAWFLAAPQGFVTIRHGLRGMSKSFSGDRASGAVALYYGARAVAWDRNDVVFTGGCEAPVSPLSLLCFHSSGDLSEATDPRAAFLPFDHRASGLVVGEGGVVLVLEEAGRARRRGAQVYGEVLGGAHGTSANGDPRGYARVLERALGAAGCAPADVDLVLAEGCASPAGDRLELEALASVFGRDGRRVPVAVPKAAYGHLYGAGFGTDVVCGLLAARHGVRPPTPGFEAGDVPAALDVVPGAGTLPVERFLVASRSRYGNCVAMVFGRPPGRPAS
jgi:3-oxoacyl-[acyl-carrier-protein] synthase II